MNTNTNIVLNGNDIKIQLQNIESFSLESFNKSIDDLKNQTKQINILNRSLEKMTNIFDIVSNVKAMESIGYTSTEGLGDNLKEAGKKIIEKVKEIIERIKTWVKKVVGFIINQIKRFIAFIKSKFQKTKPLCKEDLENIKSADIPSNENISEEKEKEINAKTKVHIEMIKSISEKIQNTVDEIVKYRRNSSAAYTDENNKKLDKLHSKLKSFTSMYLSQFLNIVKSGVKIPHLDEKLKYNLHTIEDKVYDSSLPSSWSRSTTYWNYVKKIIDLNNNNKYEYPTGEIASIESFQAWEGVSNDIIQLGQSIDKILYVCKKAKENNINWDLSKYFNEIEKELKELEKISDIEFLKNTTTVGADKLANIETDISDQADKIKLKLSKIKNVFNNTNNEEMKSDININSNSSLKEAIKELSKYIPNKSDANKYINSVKSYAEQKVDKLKDYCDKLNKYCNNLDRNAKTSPSTEMRRLNTKVQALRSIHNIYNEIILDLQSTLNFSSILLSAKEKLNKVYNIK